MYNITVFFKLFLHNEILTSDILNLSVKAPLMEARNVEKFDLRFRAFGCLPVTEFRGRTYRGIVFYE